MCRTHVTTTLFRSAMVTCACAFAALGRYPLSTYNWWLPPGMMSELLVPVYPDWCGLLARWQLVGHVVLVCHNIMYQPHMYHWFQLLKTLYFLGGFCPCPTVPPAASDALLTDDGSWYPKPGRRPVLLRLPCARPPSAVCANAGGGAG